jgi:HEAT repeat protein
LGWIQTPDALNGLAQGLETVAPTVQLEIVAVLGRVASPVVKLATALLVKVLQACSDWVQSVAIKQAIAHSLGQLRDPQAIDSLIQLLADESASVRLHAIAALKQLEADLVCQRFHYFAHAVSSPPLLKRGIAIAQQEL